MGLYIYVLNVAVVNLVMGFAVAVLFGHGPQRWPYLGLGSWRRLTRFWRPRPAAVVPQTPAEMPAPAALALPAVVESPALPSAASPAGHLGVSPAPAAAISIAKPTAAPLGLAAPPDEFGDLNWALPLDAVLAQLQSEAQRDRGQLAALAERAHRCSLSPAQEEIAACVAELLQVSRNYLAQQEGALAMLDDTLASEEEEHADLGESVRQATQEQSELLRRAVAQLGQWQPAGQHLAEQSQQLLAQTQEILAACDRVAGCVGSAAAKLHQRQSPAPAAVSPGAAPASPEPASPEPATNLVHTAAAQDEAASKTVGEAEEADEANEVDDEEALYAAVARTLADFGGLRDGLPAAPVPAQSITT
jgi:hypothetical protein